MMIRRSLLAICAAILLLAAALYAEPPRNKLIARSHFDIKTSNFQLAKETENILMKAKYDAMMVLGDTVDQKITVHVTESREEFDELTRGGLPDWGVGCAIPTKDMIVIISPEAAEYDQPYAEIVRHEWAHIALRHKIGNSYLPRFIDEGFAMQLAAQWGNSYAVTLAKAQITGSIFMLEGIDRVNFFNASQAQIAYAQSYQAVAYIITEYGQKSFMMLIDGLRDGLSLDESFQKAIGADFAHFEKEYNAHIQRNYNWLLILSDMWLIWIGLALLIVLGFLLKKKRNKDTIKRWEEEEKYQSTDFDYEEGDPWD